MANAAQEHIFLELLLTDWKDERNFLMQLNVCSITVIVNFYNVLIFLKIMVKPSVEKNENHFHIFREACFALLEVQLSKKQASKDHCVVDSKQ